MEHSETIEDTERNWSGECLGLTREMLALVSPISKFDGWTKVQREAVSLLFTAAARSTESTILLCAYGQVWDAELTLRSVSEASLKIAYMLQSREEVDKRVTEYAEDHFNVSMLKDDKKVRDLLAALGERAADAEWLPLRERLLPDDELTALRARYDQVARRSLESRWGFTGLIGSLSRSGDPLFSGFEGLMHGYSVASHLTHADYHGTSIVMERESRAVERRDTLHLAHLARILSDCLTFAHVRLAVGYRFVGTSPGPLAQARSRAEKIQSSFRTAYEDWMRVEFT